MSTINPIQNQPITNEMTFYESCVQFVYDIANKVKEVAMAILQTIFPCFFSIASSIDPNAVTQLNTGPVSQTPITDAVRHAQEQIAQQSISSSTEGTARPAATPSGGSSAPAQPPVIQEERQENHSLRGAHSAVVPQPQLPAHEAVVVGGGGSVGDEELQPQLPANENDVVGGGNDEGNEAAGLIRVDDNEWLDVPFVPRQGDGGSFADQADQGAFGVPPSAGGAAVPLFPLAEQAGESFLDPFDNVGDNSLLPNALSPPRLPVNIILPSHLTNIELPPAPAAARPAASSASSSVPPATDPAGMQQSWMLSDGRVDPTPFGLSFASSAGQSGYNTLDRNLAKAAAAAAASSGGHSNIFDEALGLAHSSDEAIPAAAASSTSAAPPLPPSLNARVDHIKQQLSQIASGNLTAAQMRAMRGKQNSADADDNKELTGSRVQSAQPTQRTVVLQQGSGEEPVGFFATCTVAINWKENFDEFISESSEYDEILEQARTEFNKHREGNFFQIAQNEGMEFEGLGIARSRHAWVDTLQNIAITRNEPMVVILINDFYSVSYTIRIVPKGREIEYYLFSPNTDWHPTVGDEIDPIYQSGQGSEALKNILPKTPKKYRAFELIGSANSQHNNGTGSSDQFSATAALPPGGVHAVAAPNPEDQDPNPYTEQP